MSTGLGPVQKAIQKLAGAGSRDIVRQAGVSKNQQKCRIGKQMRSLGLAKVTNGISR